MDNAGIEEVLASDKSLVPTKREQRVKRDFWKTFRKAVRYVPFSEDVVAAYYCALDPNTPSRVRGTLLAALAYFVLPLDMIPDFIIGAGFGDDLAVLTAVITAIRGHITDEHYNAARSALEREE